MHQWMRLAAVLLLLTGSAWSQSIFGAAYSGPGGPATLYVISPTTGAAAAIGPIGAATVSSIAFAPDGVTLYGVGIVGLANFDLIKINTSTGAGTPIGATGLRGPCQDMAFRSDGTLFCYSLGGIFTINTSTGVATLVGLSGGFPDGNGLAFLGNVLYTANQNELDTINQSTGAATLAIPLIYSSAFGAGESRAAGMKFHPNGTLYAAVTTGGQRGVASTSSLGIININTGAVIRVGPTAAGMDALAISSVTLAASPVPAPASWKLVAIGLGLVTLIQVLWRRNKARMVS
jgi:hypothetical protein